MSLKPYIILAALTVLLASCEKEKGGFQAVDGEVVVLQEASRGNGVDLVLMGDGYTAKQIRKGEYDKVMRTAAEDFFSENPLGGLRDLFNVIYIVGVSEEEGCYNDHSTCFSAKHQNTYSSSIKGNTALIRRFTSNAIGEERLKHSVMAVVMNSGGHGGTTHFEDTIEGQDFGDGSAITFIPYMSGGEQFRQVMLHESAGHALAKLGDEYYYESNGSITEAFLKRYENYAPLGYYRNIDITNDLDKVKWKHFINDERYASEKISTYLGGMTFKSGVYRPTYDSLMGSQSNPHFNAPSREAIYINIHKRAFGAEWSYDYEDFVKYDQNCLSLQR